MLTIEMLFYSRKQSREREPNRNDCMVWRHRQNNATNCSRLQVCEKHRVGLTRFKATCSVRGFLFLLHNHVVRYNLYLL